ncbi:hypothetical protein RND81_09G065800, partial [Saponaria officinalis]
MAVGDDHREHLPSFFKVILEPRHDLLQLVIPKEFVINNGSDLLDDITLRIPTGKTWKVELVKEENGKALLIDGWPEFVKYNSISHGTFLVFSYEKKSQFNVSIFDTTACEIEYSIDLQETKTSKKITSEAKINKDSSGPRFSSN